MEQEYERIGSQGDPENLDPDQVTNSNLSQWISRAANRHPSNLFPTWLEKSTSPLITPNITINPTYHSTPIPKTASLPDLTYITADSIDVSFNSFPL